MNRFLVASAAGVLVMMSLGGCVNRAAQEQAQKTEKTLSDPTRSVTTESIHTVTLSEHLLVTGDVTAGEDTAVSAKTPGRITAVYVKDGDSVAAGQLIATLDATQPEAQLRQAQAQVGTAMASAGQALAARAQANAALAQAVRNARTKPRQTESALRQAQAQVQSAQAQLKKALAGARPEERRQAESNVESAKSNLQTQEAELKRVETLVREGALAGNRLDQQRNATQSARTQYQNAVEALNVIQNGTRSEDIEVARSAVRQAEEAVQNARALQDLDPLLKDQVDAARAQVDTTKAQYESAQAQIESARAQVAIAQQALSDTRIVAPFSGKVAGRPAQVGTIAGTATTIARIVGGAGIYFTGQVPSTQVAQLRKGMPVEITVDAVSDRKFAGTVAAVSPLGASVGRLFDVRIQFTDGGDQIRGGMFARGSITVRTVPNATVIPRRAIVSRSNEQFIFIVDGDKAKKVVVKPGLSEGDYVQVTGLAVGTKVVVAGQQTLTEGNLVREEAPAADTAGARG